MTGYRHSPLHSPGSPDDAAPVTAPQSPSLTRCVREATAASVVIASSRGCARMLSPTQTESNSSSSARIARSMILLRSGAPDAITTSRVGSSNPMETAGWTMRFSSASFLLLPVACCASTPVTRYMHKIQPWRATRRSATAVPPGRAPGGALGAVAGSSRRAAHQ